MIIFVSFSEISKYIFFSVKFQNIYFFLINLYIYSFFVFLEGWGAWNDQKQIRQFTHQSSRLVLLRDRGDGGGGAALHGLDFLRDRGVGAVGLSTRARAALPRANRAGVVGWCLGGGAFRGPYKIIRLPASIGGGAFRGRWGSLAGACKQSPPAARSRAVGWSIWCFGV